ncbi:MAG: hypothetical protein J6A21_11280 [Lentisphaeria bacterium]|nr:hypothetical protein [Lentisphaeria bacterium]
MALYFNEDFENFMANHPAGEMNEAGLRKQAGAFFLGQTRGVFFNVNARRACYGSQVLDPLWKNLVPGDDGKYYHRGKDAFVSCSPVLKNALGAKMLYDRLGNKVFPIRIDECRRQGGKGGLSMRMNDIHLCIFPESSFHTDFWYEHPRWRLERYLYPEYPQMDGCGLDYAVPQVRELMKKFIAELFELFDMDALELDWMRTPPFFQEGTEERNAPFLEEIVSFASGKRHEAEKRFSHEIRLTVRVPSRPEEALAAGLDVCSWAKKGLVDMVVPCAFCLADGNIPLRVWRALLPEKVDLVPGLDNLSCAWDGGKRMYNNAELVFGYAASLFHDGAKDLYLFNHMDSLKRVIGEGSYEKILRFAGEKESAEKQSRRHLVTACQNLIPGIPCHSPLPLKIGESFQRLRMETGGNFAGRKKEILLGFDSEKHREKIDDFACVLNGTPCPFLPEGKELPELPENDWKVFRYAVPEGALQEGSNVVAVREVHETGKTDLVWCEIDIF